MQLTCLWISSNKISQAPAGFFYCLFASGTRLLYYSVLLAKVYDFEVTGGSRAVSPAFDKDEFFPLLVVDLSSGNVGFVYAMMCLKAALFL